MTKYNTQRNDTAAVLIATFIMRSVETKGSVVPSPQDSVTLAATVLDLYDEIEELQKELNGK